MEGNSKLSMVRKQMARRVSIYFSSSRVNAGTILVMNYHVKSANDGHV